jgi:hypothetical protein
MRSSNERKEGVMRAIPISRGRLRLHVRDGGGLTVRRAGNVVLARGAQVVATLFAGAAGATPIDRVGVGFGVETADVGATALTPPPDGSIPANALSAPVEPDDFSIATDADERLVRVSVATIFKPTVELKDVTEAGLLAGERLYNQVVFEPVTLHVGQDVTFFWEIDFPFGH